VPKPPPEPRLTVVSSETVLGRTVEIVRFERHVLTHGGRRWTCWVREWFVRIDGKDMPGHHPCRASAADAAPGWVDYLEWCEAGKPWPPAPGRARAAQARG
jgi:hypothetical protein